MKRKTQIKPNRRIPSTTPKPKPQSKPKRRRANPRRGISLYITRHLQASVSSLGQILHAPITTAMILIVIGVALALPTGLFVLLSNIQQLGFSWDNSRQISLYLKHDVTTEHAQQLIQTLQSDPGVSNAHYISPEEGLKEFKQQTDFGNALNTLTSNPLPGVIVVEPAANLQTPAAIRHLLTSLKQLPEVNVAQLDLQWVKRLFAMIHLARHFIYALALLFGVGVLLVIGNTIYLSTQRYRQEIRVLKLIGATDAFVRRPFLYTGLFYGLFGGIIAWFTVGVVLWSLQDSVHHLASLYDSYFHLHGLGFNGGLLLLLGSALLGLFGSCFVVNKHLKTI